MKTEVKNQIAKIVKNTGSHLGVVKHIITTNNQDVDFDEYIDFTNNLFNNKFKNVESKLRAGIRF
jgi:hypothetical protein